jgi:hypothetical protein
MGIPDRRSFLGDPRRSARRPSRCTENVEQRRLRLAKQRARIEREAAERLARDEDPPDFVDL